MVESNAETRLFAMDQQDFQAFINAFKTDSALRERLKVAGDLMDSGEADLGAVVAIAREAGFAVSKAEILKYQAALTLELSDEELEKEERTWPVPVKW
jgi:predicted ribosomally synthesized peptide with nif11-like leader